MDPYPSTEAPTSDPQRPHVLIVDDNQPLLEFLVLLLEDQGFALTAVTSPLQAAVLASQTRFDLVLSDVRMPKLSGPELLTEIRNTPVNRDVPAILISGQASIELGDWLPASSNTYYLRKPFGGNELLELVRHVLRWHEAKPG